MKKRPKTDPKKNRNPRYSAVPTVKFVASDMELAHRAYALHLRKMQQHRIQASIVGGNAVNAAQVVVIVWACVDRASIPPR